MVVMFGLPRRPRHTPATQRAEGDIIRSAAGTAPPDARSVR
jgi:hypothetical protein